MLKPSGQSNTILGRRLVGGENEKYVVKLFVTVRLAQEDNREPGDVNITNNKELLEEDDKDFEYMPSGK